MRITQRQLRQIIKEELVRSLREGDEIDMGAMAPVDQSRAPSIESQFTPEVRANVEAYLKMQSSFTIVREGPGAWNEKYDLEGTGNFVWQSAGSMIVPHRWERSNGQSFMILAAQRQKDANGEMIPGLSIQVITKNPGSDSKYGFIKSEDASLGAVPWIKNKTEFVIPAKLRIEGSPGRAGMFSSEAMMELTFTAV